MTLIIHLYSLLVGLPTVLKYFGLMQADVVALTESGDPWSEAFDFATEPVYTRQKPSNESAALAGASVLYSLKSLF